MVENAEELWCRIGKMLVHKIMGMWIVCTTLIHSSVKDRGMSAALCAEVCVCAILVHRQDVRHLEGI